jgi:hypothetical protein
VKIFGGLAMGAVYLFYYKGGDTFYYFYDSKTFYDALHHSPDLFVKLLFLPANTSPFQRMKAPTGSCIFRDPSGWAADKVYGFIALAGFHSYPAMTVITATLTFTGRWALFRTFSKLYPALTDQFALAILFVPSVFFWGSGILKDSITFGCLGWMTYCSYLIFFRGRKIVSNALLFLLTAYIAIQLKAYIVISFLPALLFWIFFTYRNRISNQFLRVIIGPTMFAVSLFLGIVMIKQLGDQFARYSLDNLMVTVKDFHAWHLYLAENENASGYSFGDYDGSLSSLITKIPAAINVTLFRPYLWEVNNVVMLAAAIESSFILGFSLYILIRNGLWRTIQSAFTNPVVFFCFFFSGIFAFAVGFTTYNFGALVRYKIPCIPFFLVGLIILNRETTVKRIAATEERERQRNRHSAMMKKRNELARAQS